MLFAYDIYRRVFGGFRRPSPVTVAEKKYDRFQVQKKIMFLEMLIDEREIEIKQLDQEYSNACRSGKVSEDEKKEYAKILEKKLIERKEAVEKLRSERIRLIDAETAVVNEQAFETL